MPIYFFDLLDGPGLICDEEGADLPDDEAARARAISELRPIIAHEVLNGYLNRRAKIIVRSAERGEVLAIGFEQAIRIDHDEAGSEGA